MPAMDYANEETEKSKLVQSGISATIPASEFKHLRSGRAACVRACRYVRGVSERSCEERIAARNLASVP